MKQLIITIDDEQQVSFQQIGNITPMEYFGISRLLNIAAEAQETEKIRLALLQEGVYELALAESFGRPDSRPSS